MLRAVLSASTRPLVYLGAIAYWVVAAQVIGRRLDPIRVRAARR